MTTSSEIKKISENEVSTSSDIRRATGSSIRVSSISNMIKKGSIDVYGNIIDYDPNEWVGEDVEIENESIKSEDFKVDETYGTLDIQIPDYLTLDNTNVELSIVDEVYNIHNIYIYYRNNYHEKIKMNKGKYKINNISFLGINGSDYVLSTREFVIENGETTYVTIDHIYNERIEEIVASISEIKNKEVISQKRSSRVVPMIIIFAIIGTLIYLYLKKRKERDEEY